MNRSFVVFLVVFFVLMIIISFSVVMNISDKNKIDKMYIYTNEHIPVDDEDKINDIEYDYLIICFDYDSEDEICDKKQVTKIINDKNKIKNLISLLSNSSYDVDTLIDFNYSKYNYEVFFMKDNKISATLHVDRYTSVLIYGAHYYCYYKDTNGKIANILSLNI